MTFLKKLRNYFFYCGIDREEYQAIKKNAYIGANTVICQPVTIGEGAIIGASSVVIRDIPPFEIWAGNPARFIRKRE